MMWLFANLFMPFVSGKVSTLLTISPNGTLATENKTTNGTFDTEAGNVAVAVIVYLILAVLVVIVIVACIYVWTCGPKAIKNEASTRRSLAVSKKTKQNVVHPSKGAIGK